MDIMVERALSNTVVKTSLHKTVPNCPHSIIFSCMIDSREMQGIDLGYAEFMDYKINACL